MKPNCDDRDRQGQSLRRWEKQKAEWDRIERNMAKRVGKQPNETLSGQLHHFRLRQEELGMIDVSVPADVKNGVSAWEMNLRATTGGVRYVQVGSSYPYPLYCPIRDAETVKEDNHVLMKVIPPGTVAKRDKPVSDGEYFKSRQQEFRRHIKKKFSHYNDSGFLGIEGQPPPTVDAPNDGPTPQDAWAFVPYNPPEQVHPPSHTPTGTADRPASRPLSAVTSTKNTHPSAQHQNNAQSALGGGAAQQGGQHEGPMLVFSTAQLNFVAQPNEAVQATLRIDNTGSTAVFYSWVPCENDSVVTEGCHNNSSNFRLSDTPNGVLLPEDEKYCTFAFRSLVPGIFSQQFELLTVPAGRERIVISLRGVVPSSEDNPLATQDIDIQIESKTSAVACREILSELIMAPVNNAFDISTAERAVADRKEERAAPAKAVDEEQARRRELWEDANASYGKNNTNNEPAAANSSSRPQSRVDGAATTAPENNTTTSATSQHQNDGGSAMKLPYNREVYHEMSTLYDNFQSMMNVINHSGGGGGSSDDDDDDDDPPIPVVHCSSGQKDCKQCPATTVEKTKQRTPWNGSIQSFIESLAVVKDVTVRCCITSALNSLILAASAANAEEPEEPLKQLLWRACGRQAFGEAADRIAFAKATARDIVDGKGTLKNGAVRIDPKDKKAAAAAAKKAAPADKKGDKGGAANTAAADGDGSGGASSGANKEEADHLMQVFCRRIVGDSIEAMLTMHERAMDTIHASCHTPISAVILPDRMKEIREMTDPEIEIVADPTAKPKKK